MKASDFINLLYSVMPSSDELSSLGLDDEGILEIQSGFKAKPRSIAVEPPALTGELGKLIEGFDCTSIEVGLVHFDPGVQIMKQGYRFGLCEADPIVIGHDGRVIMYDHADLAAKPISCASDPDRFLDSLGVFLKIRATASEWGGRSTEAAALCSRASGSLESGQFYVMLCSFLEQ
jgi:hypothetical protein